jgi:hypothetical protein
MSYVDDAFEKMRQAGEVTKGEQQLAQNRHRRIRETVDEEWCKQPRWLALAPSGSVSLGGRGSVTVGGDVHRVGAGVSRSRIWGQL